MEQTAKTYRKRNAILACLRQTDSHPSAVWVYDHLKADIPDISLGTVYRNLALFQQQGQIISLGTVGGVERFDGNTAPHVHFVCTRCGAILDLPEIEVPQSLTTAAAQRIGGQITACQLTYHGICSTCGR